MDIILDYENLKLQVRDEITKKWNNLDEDSKLEYKREAHENSENYANLTHNIPCKPHKVFTYETSRIHRYVLDVVIKPFLFIL